MPKLQSSQCREAQTGSSVAHISPHFMPPGCGDDTCVSNIKAIYLSNKVGGVLLRACRMSRYDGCK
jgi:hypothetical protein